MKNKARWPVFLILSTLIFSPIATQAQTKIMDVEIYYTSPTGAPDIQMEHLARRILITAEAKINTRVLPRPVAIEFRIVNFVPWNPSDLKTCELPGVGMVVDYNDLLSRLVFPNNRLPSSRFYLAITRTRMGSCDEEGKSSFRVFGATDSRSQSKIV